MAMTKADAILGLLHAAPTVRAIAAYELRKWVRRCPKVVDALRNAAATEDNHNASDSIGRTLDVLAAYGPLKGSALAKAVDG